MRTISGPLILLAGFAQGALADTPASAASATWTGFYTGVSLGAIINESHLNAWHNSFIDSIFAFPNAQPYGEHMDTTDVLPGIHAGYNHQLISGLVLGGEADFTYPDSSSEFTRRGPAINPTTVVLFDKFTFKNRLQGALRGRIGYSVGNFLPYVTAGVSFADTGLSYTNEAGNQYKKDTVQTGWILGAGVEYALFGNFSVRTEYLYTDYGDPISIAIPTVAGNPDPNGSAGADLATHSVRAALNYHF
jgi:outer membrane immunogenic protein